MAFICIVCIITFASSALQGMSLFELVFIRRAPDITKLKIPQVGSVQNQIKIIITY